MVGGSANATFSRNQMLPSAPAVRSITPCPGRAPRSVWLGGGSENEVISPAVMIFMMVEALLTSATLFPNQRLPSGPTVRAVGDSISPDPNASLTPSGLIRVNLFPSKNQRLPSGPLAMRPVTIGL